jgi:hypothetical protein
METGTTIPWALPNTKSYSNKAASNGDSVPVMSQSLRHEVFEHNIILTVDISDVGDDLLFWEGGSIVIIIVIIIAHTYAY